MSAEKIRFVADDFQNETYRDCLCLRDVMNQIEDQAKKKGRVVCSVCVNGLALDEEDELRLGSTLKKDINFIEVETELPAELLRSTIASQLELMNEIDRVAQVASCALRDMDLSRGHELLISLLDGCRWFTDALIAIRKVRAELAPGANDAQDEIWRAAEGRLQKVLIEVLQSVETEDKLLLADLLEYELANSLEPWRDLLKQWTE